MNNLTKQKSLSFFLITLTLILLTISCSKIKNPVLPTTKTLANSNIKLKSTGQTTEALIRGTFVDFWNKAYWSDSDWDTYVKNLKDIGITTIIIQFSAYDQYCWFYSDNTFTTEKFYMTLPRLLYAASINGLEVYVGLYFSADYWSHTKDISWLQQQANYCKKIANDIWKQYSGYMAFKGWYIAYEPARYYYQTEAQFNIVKNNLINPVSDYCHSISGRPVAISTFFNDDLTSTAQLIYFMKWFSTANVDIIMLQDGIGVGHADLSDIGNYYNAAKWGLYGEGNFSGKFWADCETFEGNYPASFSRVKNQLDIASWYADKIVSYQHYEDMYEAGPNGTKAAQLRTDYKNYYLNY